MFKELIKREGEEERPELNGAYIGTFLGVKERQRATFETRLSPEPVMEDAFVFEFEVKDFEIEEQIRVSKWVRKPPRLDHPGKNGKVSNLYKMLAALYGVKQMTDEQLQNAEEFVKAAVGREYQLTIETTPSGWYKIVHIAPVRKANIRKKDEDEEVPF